MATITIPKRVQTYKEAISSRYGNIAPANTTIPSLPEATVQKIMANTEVDTTIPDIIASITDLSNTVNALTGTTITVGASVTEVGTSVLTLQATVNSLSNTITSLDTSVNGLITTTSSLSTTVTSHANTLTNLSTTVAGKIGAADVSLTGNTKINSLGVGTDATGTTGEIRATNNITAYYSDDQLKTRLGKIENALDKIDQLTGFYYEANELAQSMGYQKVREVGVSAQDTKKVMGEIVAPAPIDDRYLTVRYERFAPLLIEGIKELRAELKLIKQHLNI